MRVYSNLFRIREEHWRLFEHPDVRLATTHHSIVAAKHDAVPGRAGSHRVTRANIVEAVRRGIRLKVAVLDAGDHERAERSASSLCGRCGDQKAAVLPNGSVSVCELGRFLTAGSVRETSTSLLAPGIARR
ncbi:hypothetical protein [Streptomyces sp. NPDC058295]|uniref:hypothetical protein n=1 Tax=Streptomyces sp. NPDC058295 TaxID=3346431 RepID=UPI0036EBFBE5